MPNFKLDERVNCLALVLMDALRDENESVIYSILEQMQSDTSYLHLDRGIAPLHFSCAIKNSDLALKVTERLLSTGVTPNVRSGDLMTPLHVAAIMGRTNLVELLLKHGAYCDVYDANRKTPLHYAIERGQFEVLQLMREHITTQMLEKTQQEFDEEDDLSKELSKLIKPLELQDVISMDLKQHFDMKPIKITTFTHNFNGGQNGQSSAYSTITNINDGVTPRNLSPQYTQNRASLSQSFSTPNAKNRKQQPMDNAAQDRAYQQYIDLWREKVQQTHARKSVLQHYDNINIMLNDIMENDHLNFTNIQLDEEKNMPRDFENTITIANMQQVTAIPRRSPVQTGSLGTFIQKTAQAQLINVEQQPYFGEVYVGRKPSSGAVVQYFLQMVESYVHTDDQHGLIFYENKYLSNETKNKVTNSTLSAFDPDIIALSYDKELASLARKDLGTLNYSKRLCNKRMIKYQRKIPLQLHNKVKKRNFKSTEYSIELTHTLRSLQGYQYIPQYLQYETKSRQHFDKENVKTRGLPQSRQYFIYLLLDPRMTCNLPGEFLFLDNLTIWNRFLNAIFYVGKGKDFCPYGHLYDAMKMHTNQRIANKQDKTGKPHDFTVGKSTHIKKQSRNKLQKSHSNCIEKHVQRMLDIWRSNNGVVCLHIFPNSSSLEAITVQAAIIDAIGLGHLCNDTRCEYHGPAQRWTMKERKCMGISLLYNALQSYMSEGESQISPSDLI